MGMANNVSLILEGGGMRGAYTAGVLEFFHDEGLEFPLVATSSSGSLIGSSYVAKQRGRNYKLLTELLNNPASISYKRVFRQRELFGMDFIFQQIPNEVVPFDFEAFTQADAMFVVGTTDINVGKPLYFDTYETKDDLLTVMRASSSLPLLAPCVHYQGKELMDGGISDPIPINPALKHGYKKHVVILTRNKGYVKRATRLNWLFKHAFPDKPELRRVLRERHLKYNETMNRLKEMETRGEVLFIQPEEPLAVSRTERKREKLFQLYQQGYEEAEQNKHALYHFLDSTEDFSASLS